MLEITIEILPFVIGLESIRFLQVNKMATKIALGGFQKEPEKQNEIVDVDTSCY